MKTAGARHQQKPLPWLRLTCAKCGFSWIRRDSAFQKPSKHYTGGCGGALRVVPVKQPKSLGADSA